MIDVHPYAPFVQKIEKRSELLCRDIIKGDWGSFINASIALNSLVDDEGMACQRIPTDSE